MLPACLAVQSQQLYWCTPLGLKDPPNYKDEYPAFSPEGLISWMFERCNRRFEEAMMIGDVQKANAYNQRRALLVDFLVQQGISMNQRIPSIGEFKKAMWPWLLFKL